MNRRLLLTLVCADDKVAEVYDALNETLNDLVRLGVLPDEDDNAWYWFPDGEDTLSTAFRNAVADRTDR